MEWTILFLQNQLKRTRRDGCKNEVHATKGVLNTQMVQAKTCASKYGLGSVFQAQKWAFGDGAKLK